MMGSCRGVERSHAMISIFCAIVTIFSFICAVANVTILANAPVKQGGGNGRWARCLPTTRWPSGKVTCSHSNPDLNPHAFGARSLTKVRFFNHERAHCREIRACWINPPQSSKSIQEVNLENSHLLVFIGEGCTYCEVRYCEGLLTIRWTSGIGRHVSGTVTYRFL